MKKDKIKYVAAPWWRQLLIGINTMLWILGEKNALRELLFRKEEKDSVAVSQ
jgi:hypothetical protein